MKAARPTKWAAGLTQLKLAEKVAEKILNLQAKAASKLPTGSRENGFGTMLI